MRPLKCLVLFSLQKLRCVSAIARALDPGFLRWSVRRPEQRRVRSYTSAASMSLLVLVSASAADVNGASAHAATVVVISAKAPVVNFSNSQIADIFLGKARQFPDGRMAVPVDQLPSSKDRETFYLKVSGKTPALMTAYWSKLIFTGESQPPREVSNAETVRKLIAADPALIGYMDSSLVDSSVQVIAVLP